MKRNGHAGPDDAHALSPRAQAALARRLRRRRESGAAERIPRCSREGTLPLSFAQERLWFLEQLMPGSPAYNRILAVRLQGTLDVRALTQGLDEVYRRHEALRTTFPAESGSPVQAIAPPELPGLPVTDLSQLPAAERLAEARRLADALAAAPYDLGQGPLWRPRLLRLAEDDSVLLLATHHTVSDGWSDGVLRRELAVLYGAYHEGCASPLPKPPIQYADYAAWQREWLQGEVLEQLLAYWQPRLAGPLPTLDLPTDHPRPPVLGWRGAECVLRLPVSLSAELQALCRREGATLFATLLAAFCALLYRHSGQEDLVVGMPVAGRNRSELEGLIGLFVNTLPLRMDLSGDPPFRDLLTQAREVALGALGHQEIPLERLAQALRPERRLDRSPLFQALLNLRNMPQEQAELPGLAVSPYEVSLGTALVDLELALTREDDTLACTLRYNTDLYKAPTVRRMLGHFEALLSGIVANPGRRLSALPLLSEAERRHTPQPNPASGGPCLHELFEAQERRTPHAVAVTLEGEHLTYAQLNARANRVAHYLREVGVGPDRLVGLCVERSLDMIVGLLGILKAGGAYLPLDPAYPPNRLAFMLADGGAPVLLTQQHLRERLAGAAAHVFCLDSDRPLLAAYPVENPPPLATPGSLAYVIYTSGSTGRPKGVMVTHHNVTRLFTSTWDWFRFDERDVWTLFHSYAFDFSVWEIWGALLHGGRLVIVPYWVSRSPEDFYRLLSAERVTVLNQTPSAFGQLLRAEEALGDRPELALRLVIFGGEALNLESLRPWFRRHGDRRPRLVNMYGITETTVHVTYRPLQEADLDAGYGSVIGNPIPDLTLRLLDADGRPVPAGSVGEIHVGGAGVARGYLNRPDLTAGRFIPDPFEPGARLYRSGDLARRLPGGELEYLGRADEQVKIRGFRIELGEIESALAHHPAVRQVTVAVREDNPGDRRLAAYIVADPTQRPEVADLRDLLAQTLPDYMIPAAYVFLDALPLTPSGKVDRRALPVPPADAVSEGHPYAAPRGPVEEMLAGLWAELLGREQIGVDEDFFLLGGHSLLAAQLVARLREVFHVEVPVVSVFQHRTIAALARLVEELGEASTTAIPPILPVPRDRPLPLSLPQERVWFLDQLAPGNLAYNAQFTVRLRGRLDLSAFNRALTELVRRHEILRTSFPAMGGRPAQRIEPPFAVSIPVIDVSSLPEDRREPEAERLVAEECSHPFDITRAPLVRWTLLRLAEEDHVFIHVEHHLVHDGWSQGVLLREIKALYTAFAAGQPSPLAEPAIQYADWASWQREWMQGEVLASQLAYWRERLAGSPPLLELPADRPRPERQSFRGHQLVQELEPELCQALRRLSRAQGATLFMTLLAAFKTLLFRYTGQEDVLVGSGVANRRHREAEGLIGMMVNTLVLRTDLSGAPTFRELLQRVRTTVLGAHAYQDQPLDRIVQELHLGRDLGRNPLFQVMFSFHDSPVPDLDFAGLTGTLRYRHNESAKFDLNLIVIPRGEQRVGLAPSAEDDCLLVEWEYSTDLFDAATITRMMAHYHHLLEAIVADAGSPITTLPLLSEGERRRLLVEWNDTRTGYPRDRCLHELYEEQARRSPEAVAAVCQGHALTYGDLNTRANRLARYLHGHGVGPETLVGLCVERSLELLVGLLGILKAGGAYLPLDPDYPRERLAFMLEDAAPRLVLTQARLQDRLPSGAVKFLRLDADWPSIAQQDGSDPPNVCAADSLAYVMYTSGSTGRPKGVEVLHRGVVRLVLDTNYVELTAQDVLLQFAPISFDASTFEIWGALLNGAKLVLMPPGPASLGDLADAVEREGVTVLWLTASLFNAMVSERCGSLKPLRLLLAGGEALSVPHVLKAARQLPGCRLLNGYGPTENTTFTCCYPVPAEPSFRSSVPIGRPIANTQVYILDAALQPVPVGVPGELYIGGDGLARGYLGHPELTAEQFIPNPFGEAGSRLYRTGDLARYLQDGNIDFLGRLDRQVKIRGFRIEPGEVEANLLEHPAVREAAVVVREDTPGEKRLVAYVVLGPGHAVAGTGLRLYLQEKLPPYMIPSAIVLLDALPLNPNGKVDRRALPAPSGPTPAPEGGYVAPRDGLEMQLAGLWARLLGLPRVGVRDGFFDLGGHSLLGARLLAEVEELTGRRLPLAALFQAPTVEGMATILRQEGWNPPPTSLVPLQPAGSKPPFFAVFGLGGGVLHYRQLADHLGTDRPFYAFTAPGLDGQQLPPASIEELATHCIEQMRFVQPEGPYRLGGYSIGGIVAFEMAQQLHALGEQAALLALLDPGCPGYARALRAPARIPGHVLAIRARGWRAGALYLRDKASRRVRRAVRRGACRLAGWLRIDPRVLVKDHEGLIRDALELAAARYTPRTYCGAVALFLADGKKGRFHTADPRLGWREQAGGGLEVHRVPGDHLTLIREPHVRSLAAELRACLARVDRAGAGSVSSPEE